MADNETAGLAAKVLTVSDGVIAGTRQDGSGDALVEMLTGEGYDIADRRAVEDGIESVRDALLDMSEGYSLALVVTTGGNRFWPPGSHPGGHRRRSGAPGRRLGRSLPSGQPVRAFVESHLRHQGHRADREPARLAQGLG